MSSLCNGLLIIVACYLFFCNTGSAGSPPAAAPLSSSAFILLWPQPTAGGHALFNYKNTPLLQPFSDAVYTAFIAAIVSLSHTHQVISLKLTDTNYLY
jgi:hypothetical protein